MDGLNRSTGSACLGPSPGATLRGRSHHPRTLVTTTLLPLCRPLCRRTTYATGTTSHARQESERLRREKVMGGGGVSFDKIKNFEARVIVGRLAPTGGSSQAPGSAVAAETPPTGSQGRKARQSTIASESVYSNSRCAAVSTNMTGIGRPSTHTCDPETHTRHEHKCSFQDILGATAVTSRQPDPSRNVPR